MIAGGWSFSPWSVRTSGPAGSTVVDGEQRFAAGLCRALTVASIEPKHTITHTHCWLIHFHSGSLKSRGGISSWNHTDHDLIKNTN